MKKILLTGLYFAVFLPLSAQNNLSEQSHTIEVTGTAEMEFIPDQIFVSFDLKEYDQKNSGKIPIAEIKSNFLKSYHEAGIQDSLISIDSYEALNR